MFNSEILYYDLKQFKLIKPIKFGKPNQSIKYQINFNFIRQILKI